MEGNLHTTQEMACTAEETARIVVEERDAQAAACLAADEARLAAEEKARILEEKLKAFGGKLPFTLH